MKNTITLTLLAFCLLFMSALIAVEYTRSNERVELNKIIRLKQAELDTYNACRRINDFRLGSKNHTDSVLCEETFVKSIKLGVIQKVSSNPNNKLFTDSLLTEIVNY